MNEPEIREQESEEEEDTKFEQAVEEDSEERRRLIEHLRNDPLVNADDDAQ